MFMNAMYEGLGQSTNAIIGGKLQSRVGTVNTFLYSAMTDFFLSFALQCTSVLGKIQTFGIQDQYYHQRHFNKNYLAYVCKRNLCGMNLNLGFFLLQVSGSYLSLLLLMLQYSFLVLLILPYPEDY